MAAGKVLAGTIALVTGGASGIGRATCELFAKHGASIVVVDRSQGAIDETVASLPCDSADRHEQMHKGFIADVGEKDDVKSVVAMVTDVFQRPASILVNSAGIYRDEFMTKMTEETFDEVIRVNLKGTFLMCQAASEAMIKAKVNQGSIVNISSVTAQVGLHRQCNYTASKAGVVGLTRTLAKELSRFNIRCNSILPGGIMTPMIKDIPEKDVKMMLATVPMGRLGRPEEIADACLFLASSSSSYITGASLDVNGGMYM